MPTHAEQVFVSDITYIKLQDRPAYLALVTDLYSKKVMGYKLADNMKAGIAQKMIKETVNIYNSERRHCSLEMKTPNHAHINQAHQYKLYKSKKEIAGGGKGTLISFFNQRIKLKKNLSMFRPIKKYFENQITNQKWST